MELPGTIPSRRQVIPTSNPILQSQPTVTAATVEVVAELAKWRRERKAIYEEEVARRIRSYSSIQGTGRLADSEVYVEGHWTGEVKVIRNAKKNVPKGKMERQGNVDVYGNYFEGGYLYP